MIIAQKLARGICDITFREIDVRVHPDANFEGPTICVANHFGGLSDAVLIVDNLPVMPRIVARDVIWKTPVAGQIMRALRAIPVHRRADGSGSNDDMFSSCYEALEQGSTILIFPEGVTQEPPHIAEVKTGAARIALGARQSGVADIQIVPVGLHYANKAGFRSSVLVNVGAPIDLDPWLAAWAANEAPETGGASVDVQKRQARDLTADIEIAMRHTAPDYPDWQTCRDFELAAEVMLHDVDAGSLPVRYGDRSLVADVLARNSGGDAATASRSGLGESAQGLLAAVTEYRRHMSGLRVRDLAVRRVSARQVPRSEHNWIVSLLLVLLLAPYALVGIGMVALPWLAVKATRLARLGPAVQASVTPGVAALAFGLQWLLILIRGWNNNGFDGVFLGLVLPPFFVACAVFVVERLHMLVRRVGVRRLKPSEQIAAAQEARRAVADRAWGLA